ncbi:hypothetical protein Tco_0787386 [Tanacetum coccineum]
MDFDFIPSHNDLGSDLDVSSPSGDRNKIYTIQGYALKSNPRDFLLLFPRETLLSFSSENEEKVFNPGILTSKGVHTSLLPELSHRGPKAFKDCPDFEASRAHGFVLRSLELHILSFILGIQYPKSYRLTFIFEHT